MGYSQEEVNALMLSPEAGVSLDGTAAVLLDRMIKKQEAKNAGIEEENSYEIKEIKVGLIENLIINTPDYQIPIRIYYPRRIDSYSEAGKKRGGQGLPVIAFYHGGGFTQGSINSHDSLCRTLANETSSIVVSTEYRLLPEYSFPAGMDDCYAALNWIEANIKNRGGDPKAIFTAGDSAGANFATVMCIRSTNENGPAIKGQILYYPPTTFEMTEYPSRLYYGGSYGNAAILSEKTLKRISETYLRGPDDVDNPYASPLKAEIRSDFVPALIITAQCDVLRDEGKAYHDKLTAAGAVSEYYMYEGMIHGFVSFSALLPAGRDAIEKSAGFIKRLSSDY